MTRKDILMKADQCVNGQREHDYGTPEDNFRRIADLWSTYLDRIVTPVDVSMMMCLLKIARVSTSESPIGPTDDCFIDIAGYAACGGELKAKTAIFDPDSEPISI